MPNKKFRVYYKSNTVYHIDVKAKDYIEAQLKAQKIDGGDFEQEGTGDWEFDSVKELD